MKGMAADLVVFLHTRSRSHTHRTRYPSPLQSLLHSHNRTVSNTDSLTVAPDYIYTWFPLTSNFKARKHVDA